MLKIAEVAEYLRISEWKVNQLLVKGELSGHRFGGEWRVSPQQVDEYLSKTLNVQRKAEQRPKA
jgi:excisionase family DNA binding protein